MALLIPGIQPRSLFSLSSFLFPFFPLLPSLSLFLGQLEIIRSRSVECLSFPLTVATFLTSTSWTLYGMQLQDFYIMVRKQQERERSLFWANTQTDTGEPPPLGLVSSMAWPCDCLQLGWPTAAYGSLSCGPPLSSKIACTAALCYVNLFYICASHIISTALQACFPLKG